MNKKLLMVVSFMILVFLISANVLRYEQIEDTASFKRTVDRWTGIEWVRVISPTGVSRMPAKYYDYQKAPAVASEEVIADLRRIKNTDDALNIAWYVSIIGNIVVVLYQLKNIKKSYETAKGGH